MCSGNADAIKAAQQDVTDATNALSQAKDEEQTANATLVSKLNSYI
jgi:hypothetical protein